MKGANFFEPYIEEKIKIATREGSEFFAIVKCPLDIIGKDDEKKLTSVFYCKDVPGLTDFIMEKRGYDLQTEKIQLFGFDKDKESLKKVFNLKRVENEFSGLRGKRASYFQGAHPRAFKDGGVNRTILIAFAEKAKESYHNLKVLMSKVNLSYLDIESPYDTNDLSLTPIFLGIGPAMSTFPCHLCEMPRLEFGNPSEMLKGGDLRTIGSLYRNSSGYQEALRNHKGKAKLSSAPWKNCENKPLYDLNSVPWSTLVIQLMPPPEL